MNKFLVVLIAFLFVSPIFASAQSACEGVGSTNTKSRAQLEAELAACEKEAAEWEAELKKAQSQSAGFQTDINALTAKINAAQANIKAKNIAISNLSKDIVVKENKISDLNSRIERGKAAIADILRKTNDINSFSLVETILSDKDLSDFFVDIDAYASTDIALKNLFAELRSTKALTEAEKAELNKKKEAEASARAAIEAAKKTVETDKKEKDKLLAISKNNEKTYAQEVAERKAKASQIRAVLFPLRDAGAISFGTALQYAESASGKTGVPSSLILAILQQESNLGANVGSCVITNLSNGETRSIKTGNVFKNGIHPTRDLPVLQDILGKLGGDPMSTKVSCPIVGVPGYGGAMGPAQFIPSTWKIMEGKVANALGKGTPNPWDPQDAIMAMALYLKDIMGSTGDSYTDQRTAACRYYSGRTCYVGGKAGPGLSYGNQVMGKVANIQRDIDFLQDV